MSVYNAGDTHHFDQSTYAKNEQGSIIFGAGVIKFAQIGENCWQATGSVIVANSIKKAEGTGLTRVEALVAALSMQVPAMQGVAVSPPVTVHGIPVREATISYMQDGTRHSAGHLTGNSDNCVAGAFAKAYAAFTAAVPRPSAEVNKFHQAA